MNTSPSADARGGRIVIVAHCLLNQNAKVHGLAASPGVIVPLATLLVAHGVGIIQMPCPELVHLGPSRPLGTDTIDQYDTPDYRRACQRIAATIAAEAAAYASSGCAVLAILGVEGSPSCSVCRAPVLENTARVLRPGRGLFMEALASALTAKGLTIPFVGIPEVPEAGNMGEARALLTRLLQEGERKRLKHQRGSGEGSASK